MATRYPRIATGLPGGIANKIYRKNQNIRKHSGETRDMRHRDRDRERTRTKKHSRASSDRSDLTEESDFETNSDIMRNFNNLDRDNHHGQRRNNKLKDNLTDYLGDRGKFHSMLEEREKKKPSKPNHYVPFDPRDSPGHHRNSQAWSDSSQYETSNYNSDTGIITKPRLPRNLLIDNGESNEESSSERSNLSRAILSCVIIVSIISLVIVIVALLVYLTAGEGLSSRLSVGPGDNSPCRNYQELSDYWRLIGRRPSQAGVGYHCDSWLEEGWFRFLGSAGTRLADSSAPPGWEQCGTSRVVWLAGQHPSLAQGTVEVSLCVSGLSSSCTTRVSGAVRRCRGEGGEYFVYRLVPVPGPCQWAYCANNSPAQAPT